MQLACLEPVAKGLLITHWTSHDLARQAQEDGIIAQISAPSVRRILHAVDLQPHRTRYWKTSRLDALFKQRAERVLWCYSNARRLYDQGIWVVCVDEKPGCQVLERHPIRRAIPGSIEQQEFEYIRHGTVTFLFFLIAATGKMEIRVLKKKDASHYVAALKWFRARHPKVAKTFLIQDNDAAHIAKDTKDYFAAHATWWRPRFTPAHASWLNQAEILINQFAARYLKRRSWNSRDDYIAHALHACAEYNRRYTAPIAWTWSNPKMRAWFEAHTNHDSNR